MPLAFDGPILVVIIPLLEMPLSVALTAGHGTNRQHNPTLAGSVRNSRSTMRGRASGTQMAFELQTKLPSACLREYSPGDISG